MRLLCFEKKFRTNQMTGNACLPLKNVDFSFKKMWILVSKSIMLAFKFQCDTITSSVTSV